jgi:molybdopterin molybdotransferase
VKKKRHCLISYTDAEKIISDLPIARNTETVLLKDSLGRSLAESVAADRDYPPFDRSLMDGFAIIKDDPSPEFQIIDTIPAGNSPQKKLVPGTCAKIMTGAPIPKNAGQVIKVEDTSVRGGKMRIVNLNSSENIGWRGCYLKRNQVLLNPSHLIRPQEVGLLSGIGKTHVKVFKNPRVALFSTGSEVVDVKISPRGAQIRNSNGPMIEALVSGQCGDAYNLGIIPDDRTALTKALHSAFISHDVVVCTGGVSMGDFDFLPDVLRHLRFKILFSGLSIQPGKPMLLARLGSNTVFALPGNPVSAFVTFTLFVTPFLNRWAGQSGLSPFQPMRLAENFTRKSAERDLFQPGSFVCAELNRRVDSRCVKGLFLQDSGQIDVLCKADCLIQIPAGVTSLKKGDTVYVRSI